MSSIPSIRLECAQCKQSFWIKLKRGMIPNVVVACPNCSYAWDLGKVQESSIVHRSYKWDEFLMKMTALFQTKRVEDASEEIFREAGGSGDSIEESIMELPDIPFEPISEIPEDELEAPEVSELGSTSSEAVREPDSASIPRPNSEERILDVNALKKVEEPVSKSKETARYAAIPSFGLEPALTSPRSEPGVVVDEEEEQKLDEDSETMIDDDAMAAAFLELEDETIKEGPLKTQPPQLPKPSIDSKNSSFGVSKLALPNPKTLPLPGVNRESRTPPTRSEKPASDDEEHPVLPILERPLERKSISELDVRSSADEQSLELMRTEDFSTELARDQADDFFKSSAQIAAREGGEVADFTDLGGATKVSATPLVLAGLLVLMIVIAGIVALLAS